MHGRLHLSLSDMHSSTLCGPKGQELGCGDSQHIKILKIKQETGMKRKVLDMHAPPKVLARFMLLCLVEPAVCQHGL